MKKIKLFQIISCGLLLKSHSKETPKNSSTSTAKQTTLNPSLNLKDKKELEKQIQEMYLIYLMIQKTIPKTVEDYSKKQSEKFPAKNFPSLPLDSLQELDPEIIKILKIERKDAEKNNEASSFLYLKEIYLLMKAMFAPIENAGKNINLENIKKLIEKEIANLLKSKQVSSHAKKIINIYRNKYSKTKNEKDMMNLLSIYAFILVESECREVILHLEKKGFITKV